MFNFEKVHSSKVKYAMGELRPGSDEGGPSVYPVPSTPEPQPVGGIPHASHVGACLPTPAGSIYMCRRCGEEIMVRPWRSASGVPGATEAGAAPCRVEG